MKAYRICQTVKTTRFVPGYPVGLPIGALVEIVQKSGTKKTGIRYQVADSRGNRYWVDADAIAALG